MKIFEQSHGMYLSLSWDEIKGILGRSHEGCAEDDRAIDRHLIAEGVPSAFVDGCLDSGIDELSWWIGMRFANSPADKAWVGACRRHYAYRGKRA